MKTLIIVALAYMPLLLACSKEQPAPVEPVVSSEPAAKTAEAWGFDFRIDLAPDLEQEVPIGYLSQIRKAAQAWERVIWNAEDVKHIVSLEEAFGDRPFALPLTSTWIKQIWEPSTYLGWTDIEILVFMNEHYQDTEPEKSPRLLGSHAFASQADTTGWDGSFLPITGIWITPYAAQQARAGTLSKEAFYQAAVHAIGILLGFNGLTLERQGLVEITDGTCSYIGTNGLNGLLLARGGNRAFSSVPLLPNCSYWDHQQEQWEGFFDVMFYVRDWIDWNVPNDKLISRATLGVLEDLGYEIDYTEVDDTRLEQDEDPRQTSAPVLITEEVEEVVEQIDVTVSFAKVRYEVSEDDAAVRITVQSDAASDRIIKVRHTTSSRTATAGLDYNVSNGTLRFPAGTTEQTFRVRLIDDDLIEGEEFFVVTLRGSNAKVGQGEATVVIADND